MGKFLLILNRFINLYLYYVIMACFLSLVPFINPNYPLFNFIFKFAGFYLLPPFAGFAFGPAMLLIVLVLVSSGIDKIYNKFYAKENPQIIVLSPEEFIKAMNNKDEFIKSLEEGKDKKEK